MKIKNNLDLENADKQYNLPKIPSQEIKVMTVDDFWDGTLSGKCLWHDNTYYYQCFDQTTENDKDIRPRKYFLLNLTGEQMDEVDRLQESFDKSANSQKLREDYIKLYDAAPGHTITRNQILGWFDSEGLNY